jgi:hypothetical protein
MGGEQAHTQNVFLANVWSELSVVISVEFTVHWRTLLVPAASGVLKRLR